VYAFILYLVFFKFTNHGVHNIKNLDFNYKISDISEIAYFDFQNYFADDPNAIIQPINTIVITQKNLTDVLKNM
jgi:hypothetical protein